MIKVEIDLLVVPFHFVYILNYIHFPSHKSNIPLSIYKDTEDINTHYITYAARSTLYCNCMGIPLTPFLAPLPSKSISLTAPRSTYSISIYASVDDLPSPSPTYSPHSGMSGV